MRDPKGLLDELQAGISELTTSERWQRYLDVQSRFYSYSPNNVMLIALQKPNATRVAGYKTWQSLDHQVKAKESALRILAPMRYQKDDGPEGEVVREVHGFKLVPVFDVSQTDGPDLPEAVSRLEGLAPEGVFERLTKFAHGIGFRVERPESLVSGANGDTTHALGVIRVVSTNSEAQQAKTLAHDPLTAPVAPSTIHHSEAPGWSCVITPRKGERSVEDESERVGPRDVAGLVVEPSGEIREATTAIGLMVVDDKGGEVFAVSEFLASLLAGGASRSSVRSYAMALLRWWRFLAAVDVDWERASRVEARDFVLWMRCRTTRPRSGRTTPSAYAPATINHNLAVLRTFYEDRLAAGEGPVINPVPAAGGRSGARAGAHHNPMAPHQRGRRAPLRQKTPARLPRGIPDRLFNELFAAMGCDRDRALLAFYVSTGARASELLGVTMDRVDVGSQLIGVVRKGSGRLQWLPAAADAFVWLRLYQEHQSRPDGEAALWLTRRAPQRPLTYPAMRRVLQRANDSLSTTWTLHQLRHTAAQRMVADPAMSLTDVQWVLGHAHLTSTEIYLEPREAEVVARVLEHHHRRVEAPPPLPSPGYRPEVLATLFGEALGA